LPSTLTWRSSIASSSAACVFGGVRLISSASSRFVKTGPVELEFGGTGVVDQRAGDVSRHQVRVNCTRLNSNCRAAERVRTSRVLANTGHTLEQDMPAAQERDHETADDGVLADDHLGDFCPQGQQRVAR
jgi:hypothetical protein